MSDAPDDARILITGGTGFVGRNVVAALGNRPMRLLVRDRSHAQQFADRDIELVEGDVTDPASLRGAFDGCDTVLHLVAIIEERDGVTFDRNIRRGTEHVLNEASSAGVQRFFQMSALGAQNNPAFPYHQAKWRAEQAVQSSGLDWTIFRPSIIYGPGDGFISLLADVIRSYPVIPVAGDGSSRFQPVQVTDVAESIRAAIDDPASSGKTFELAGPDVFTYDQLLDLVAASIGKKKRKIHLPVSLVKLAVTAAKPLPEKLRPPVTHEQLKMLALDNTSADSSTALLLGHDPARLGENLNYLNA